ncbi:MAG: hypothetical protein JHC40_10105 [Burkholderiales bacterium]|nr:hypothetical protein [Burkholderiales bacterium]
MRKLVIAVVSVVYRGLAAERDHGVLPKKMNLHATKRLESGGSGHGVGAAGVSLSPVILSVLWADPLLAIP